MDKQKERIKAAQMFAHKMVSEWRKTLNHSTRESISDNDMDSLKGAVFMLLDKVITEEAEEVRGG